MSERPSIVHFLLSSEEYTRLWMKLKNKQVDEELIDLVNSLVHDHSSLLKVIIDYSKIKIVWADTVKQDRGYGK